MVVPISKRPQRYGDLQKTESIYLWRFPSRQMMDVLFFLGVVTVSLYMVAAVGSQSQIRRLANQSICLQTDDSIIFCLILGQFSNTKLNMTDSFFISFSFRIGDTLISFPSSIVSFESLWASCPSLGTLGTECWGGSYPRTHWLPTEDHEALSWKLKSRK